MKDIFLKGKKCFVYCGDDRCDCEANPRNSKLTLSEHRNNVNLSSNLKLKQDLLDLCNEFILTNRISCPETVYQTDKVIQNAYEFIEKICDIVGYMEPLEDYIEDES